MDNVPVDTDLTGGFHSPFEVNLCNRSDVLGLTSGPNPLRAKWSLFCYFFSSSLPLAVCQVLLACLPEEGQGRKREASLCCRQQVCAGTGLIHVKVYFATAHCRGREKWGGVFSSPQALPSQRQRSKRSFPGRIWIKSTVTLWMTSKCSCSEQCQFSIFFVAGYILEGSLRQNAFPITNQLPAFWMVSSSGSKSSKSVVSVLF